jgi:hypothetical protein
MSRFGTFTRSLMYTLLLLGAVRCTRLLRPPAFKSTPYTVENVLECTADEHPRSCGFVRFRKTYHGGPVVGTVRAEEKERTAAHLLLIKPVKLRTRRRKQAKQANTEMQGTDG